MRTVQSQRFGRPLLAGVFVVCLAAQISSQQAPPVPTREQLATDNKLFISLAEQTLRWEEPEEPVRIAGPLYFVGTKGTGSAQGEVNSREEKDVDGEIGSGGRPRVVRY